MNNLLIVDDEAQMRQLLTLYLKQYGYELHEAVDGEEAFEKIKKTEYDLIILDIMMPNMDGWEALDKIRDVSDVPILLLTAKGNTEDKVIGLTSGADDYLVKPFEEAELVARIQALLRRAKKTKEQSDTLKYKGITMSISSREAYYQEMIIRLTQTEFDILQLLIENKGRVFSREQLIEYVWGLEFTGDDRTIDSHIRNLRNKLKDSGINEQIVQTVWGVGYKVQ